MKLGKLVAMGLVFGAMTTAAFAAEYEFKMGMTSGTSSNEYKAAQFFAKQLKDKSKGEIELKLYPDAQLGKNDLDMIGQVEGGVLDLRHS